jgi:hypothetical protein
MILHAQSVSHVQRSILANMNEMSVSGEFLPAQQSLYRLSLTPCPPLPFCPMSAASDDRRETLCRTACYKKDRAHEAYLNMIQ